MKLQLQMFVYDMVDGTTATNACIGQGCCNYSYKCLYMIGLMKLELQMFVYDRVDETRSTNICIVQG